eukprot:3804546-Prymnesium_polylepis.1
MSKARSEYSYSRVQQAVSIQLNSKYSSFCAGPAPQPRYMMQACKAPQSNIWRGAGARFNVHLQPHSQGHAGAQHTIVRATMGSVR